MCVVSDSASLKTKMVTVGNSARDLGSGGYLWLCVNNIVEQQSITQVCTVVFPYEVLMSFLTQHLGCLSNNQNQMLVIT